MTNTLHLPARTDAPIACNMSTAQDTPEQRLRDYMHLFERVLLRRERRADSVVLTFRADPGTQDAVEDLARRESACCPFLDYRIDTAADAVVWTITNPVGGDDGAALGVYLDELHALPDHVGSDLAGLLERLAQRDVHVIETQGEGFELRR